MRHPLTSCGPSWITLGAVALLLLTGRGGPVRAQVLISPFGGGPNWDMRQGIFPADSMGVNVPDYGLGGGWGMGPGWGGGYGYGSYGLWPIGMGGMSLADQWLSRYQQAQMVNAQSNALNAQAAQESQAAGLLQQQATGNLAASYAGAKYGNGVPLSPGASTLTPVGTVPLAELLDADGRVIWPLSAPVDDKLASLRQQADALVTRVVRDYRPDGRVGVRAVVEARQALAAYAVPAAQELKQANPEGYQEFVNTVASLDGHLRTMARFASPGEPDRAPTTRTPRAPAGTDGPSANTRPANAPRTAGDVLRETLPPTPPRPTTTDPVKPAPADSPTTPPTPAPVAPSAPAPAPAGPAPAPAEPARP